MIFFIYSSPSVGKCFIFPLFHSLPPNNHNYAKFSWFLFKISAITSVKQVCCHFYIKLKWPAVRKVVLYRGNNFINKSCTGN